MGNPNEFHALHHNKNIDRFSLMRDEVVKSFKFNGRHTRNTFLILGLIPLGFMYIAVTDSHKWDLRGKRRDESLLKYPSTSITSKSEIE
ncbi:hypothetical protein DFH28DRAFT_504214 [Melampsora americana]|nr:hypothetical protein DFH28DRAFT_504214 [Melampsora americana]